MILACLNTSRLAKSVPISQVLSPGHHPLPCLAGEFQEVVDVKLRHTHPRVQKQRAAAANLAAAVAASAASATSSLEESDSRDHAAEEGTAPQPSSSKAAADEVNGTPSAAAAAASAAAAATVASSSGGGIQVIQVLPWADAASSTGPGSRGEVLLELDGVSINTPDGGLALVQNLSLKVRRGGGEGEGSISWHLGYWGVGGGMSVLALLI